MREVREVHHTDSGGGTAMGMMLGIVLVVAVLAVAAFFLFNGVFRSSGNTPQTNSPTNIQVNPPPQAPAPSGKVDVNVNPPAQSAPSKP